MKNVGIKNIRTVLYEGKVYNLELKSNREDEKDDLFFIEKTSGVISHNCFPKDTKSFLTWCKQSLDYDFKLLRATDEVNEEVREVKDWLSIKGATSDNNY